MLLLASQQIRNSSITHTRYSTCHEALSQLLSHEDIVCVYEYIYMILQPAMVQLESIFFRSKSWMDMYVWLYMKRTGCEKGIKTCFVWLPEPALLFPWYSISKSISSFRLYVHFQILDYHFFYGFWSLCFSWWYVFKYLFMLCKHC